MLTVRIINDSSGLQEVKEVEKVVYMPAKNTETTGNPAEITMFLRNGTESYFHPCTVYVMNEYGKTVADYRIGPPKVELSVSVIPS